MIFVGIQQLWPTSRRRRQPKFHSWSTARGWRRWLSAVLSSRCPSSSSAPRRCCCIWGAGGVATCCSRSVVPCRRRRRAPPTPSPRRRSSRSRRHIRRPSRSRARPACSVRRRSEDFRSSISRRSRWSSLVAERPSTAVCVRGPNCEPHRVYHDGHYASCALYWSISTRPCILCGTVKWVSE